MATANVVETDAFLLHVERVRGEIGTKFARAHQVLVERQSELLSQLQQLEDRYRGEGVTEEIEELNRLKEVQLATAKLNKIKDLVMQIGSQLDDRARKIREEWERERASMMRVLLEWDGEFERILNEIGAIRVSDFPDYKEKVYPVMVACKYRSEKSKLAGVFSSLNAITIDPISKNIYICDGGNDRVQVFNKSLEFLFEFSEKMNYPHGICISDNKVYVTQYWGHCLTVYTAEGKFLKSVGNEGKIKLEFDRPRGVTVSTDKYRIYVCDFGNVRIQCLNLKLSFNSFISDIPSPEDVKLSSEEIVVLTGKGDHYIRYYSYEHQLIREMIPREQLAYLFHFCIDREQNILMTDYSAHCVLIYTNKGELIHKLGSGGESRREFIFPAGIAIDSKNRIIVASRNPEHCIQIF